MLFTYSTSKKHPKDTDIHIHSVQSTIRIHNKVNRSAFKVFDGVRDLQHIMKSTRSGCSSCG
jgi:hypothetical protein